jgi:hypothetical protein
LFLVSPPPEAIDKARHLLERAEKIIASLLEDFERLLQDE